MFSPVSCALVDVSSPTLHPTAAGADVERAARVRGVGRTETQMAIDECLHKFEALAKAVLPKYMKQLGKSIGEATRADQFVATGGLPDNLANQLQGARDFPGCYVFLRGRRPVYVGISRRVRSRVRQHIRGRSQYEATLAYRMACKQSGRVGARAENMKSPVFLRRFARAKADLARHYVACVIIRNPLELHIFEAYAAMALDTAKWNTFETH